MSQVRSEPASSIYNANPNYGSTNVLISPATPLRYSGQTNTDQNYSIVYVPATRERIVVQQTYAAGIAQPLNMNNRIAVLGANGRWQPTSYAQTLGGQALVDAINRNGTTSANFNATSDYTIRQYNRQTNGRDLTQAQRNAQLAPSGNISNSIISATNAGQNPSATPTTTLPPAAPTPPPPTPPGGPGGSGPAPAGTPPQQSAADQRSDARGSGSISGNRDATRDAITTITELDALIPDGQAAAGTGTVGELKYPKAFPDNMDYVLFTAKKYGKKTFDSNTLGLGERNNVGTGDKVKLPIQTGISDANTVGWNEETFNPAQIAGAQLALGGIQEGMDGFTGQISKVVEKMRGAKGDMEKAIVAYFTEQAIGVQILPRIGGGIFNPNTELLFQGPQLRSFNFSFRFTPRSKDESLEVKKILKFFKSNMAAQTTEKELFLKAPFVFGITFHHGGTGAEHSGIGKIKDCALQACNVDYTPDGSYMSFKDGGMVSYTINLQFMELEPIYAKDYKNDHAIGY